MSFLLNKLNDCCANILSSKTGERKKNVEELHNLLENRELLDLLNKQESPDRWHNVLESIQCYLIKEADKMDQDKKKKSKTTSKPRYDVLLLAIGAAKTGCGRKLDVSRLIKLVNEIFESFTLRKYYLEEYLAILCDFILSDRRYCSKIAKQQWIDLLESLKSFNYSGDSKVLTCLKFTIKWAPLHKLPLYYLRDEFGFVSTLCQNLKDSLPKRHKIEILELLIDFSRKNSSDCCLACCKLGEDVFTHVQCLYQPTTTDVTVKELIFEFFLLQIKLHHPKGVPATDRMAYALSWNEWKKQLTTMYFIIQTETKYQMRCGTKMSFFNSNLKQAGKTQRIFVSLCTEVFRQVFNSDVAIVTQTTMQNNMDGDPSLKRQRVHVSFDEILLGVKESLSWQWIYILSEYLKNYPSSLNSASFQHLLQILQTILQENQDSDVIKHSYDCLNILLDVEKHVDGATEAESFNRVYESTLRCIGLNQNIEETHKLLQNMLSKGKIKDVCQIYETFFSGVLMLTPDCLRTFKSTANLDSVPESMCGTSYRKAIIKWILKLDSEKNELPNVYMDEIAAEILVKLCLRQWPKDPEDEGGSSSVSLGKTYESFEDIYEYNSFKKSVLPAKVVEKNEPERIPFLNEEIFNYLVERLEMTSVHSLGKRNYPSYLEDLVKKICLFGNILSMLDRCKLGDLKEIGGKIKLEQLFLILCSFLMKYDELESSDNLKYYKKLFGNFEYLVSRNFTPAICRKFRDYITVDLLKCFFDIINSKSVDGKANIADLNDLKLSSMNILSSFCFYPGCDQFSDTQEHVLDTLTESNYDTSDPFDYKMVSSFLRHLEKCPGGILKDNILGKILNLVQDICYVHFTEYDVVLEVFVVLNELVKHVVQSNNTEVRSNYSTMLYQFYQLRKDYGFEVSLSFIKCIGTFIEDDVVTALGIYPGSNLLEYISEFLTSDYQEVRLEAVKHISRIFSMDGLMNDSIFAIQRSLFVAINEKSHEVFRIETDVMTPERKVDETVARTSSVLHTYASLIISSSIWRRKLLYFLVNLAHNKKIDTDSLDKILNLVAEELKFPDKISFLASYSDYLLNEWNNDNKNITEFPYNILGLDFELQFYEKHASIIMPLFVVMGDFDSIRKMCTVLNKSMPQLYEEYFLEIFTAIFQHLTRNSMSTGSIYYGNVTEALTPDKIEELLLENLDKMVMSVAKTVVDEVAFEQQFDMPMKLLKDKEDATVQQFQDVLSMLKRKLNIPTSIFKHFSANHADKIQRILLHLHANINRKLTPEDELKALHQYATCVDFLSDHVGFDQRLSPFLVRDVTYTLLHFICDSNCAVSGVAACVYLQKFSSRVTNDNFNLLTDHLPIVVNKLVPLLGKNDLLSAKCSKLLRHFLLDNFEKFKDTIQDLDPFPSIVELDDVNSVYLQLRSQVIQGKLEAEIRHFLRAGKQDWNAGSRTDALKHLQTQLGKKKDELRALYKKSKDVKGYTRDSEGSVLHSLIRMLLKLCTSKNNKVSIEAARCLGELGPLDLATLILESKKPHQFPTSTPFQLLTSHVINLLSTYVIDGDVRLVEASSMALYDVLDSREGKNCLEAADGNVEANKEYLYPFLPKKRVKSSTVHLLKEKVEENVNEDDTWWPDTNHVVWVRTLTCKLLECFSERCFLQKLIPICRIKTSFCEQILPHLIHLIISDNSQTYTQMVVTKINTFFEKIWNLTVQPRSSSNRSKQVSIQSMLDVIHFLRLNYQNTSNLPFDHLRIAQAAYHCDNYFAALMYIELWCAKYRTVNAGCPTILERMVENESSDVSDVVGTILKQSYAALGDSGALYGCNIFYIENMDNLVEHFAQSGKCHEVLLHYDILASNAPNRTVPEMTNSLKNCGYYHVATNYHDTRRDYECLWRLGRYEDDDFKGEPIDVYEKHKYEALKGLLENDPESFRAAVDRARETAIETAKRTSLESTRVLYACLTKFQSILELEDAATAAAAERTTSDFDSLLRKWKEQDRIDKADFISTEAIKAQRISILNVFVRNNTGGLKKPLMKAYLDLADAAKSNGYFNVAMRAITNLTAFSLDSKKYDHLRVFGRAQICWSMGCRKEAKSLMKDLLRMNEDDRRLKFASLKLYGTWMAETHAENPDTILNEYFLEPLKLLREIELTEKDRENVFQMYDVIARFTDAEYQRILSYIKSAEFERKVKNMEKSKETAGQIELQANRLDYDQRKAVTIHKKQSLIDETEIENTRKEKDAYFKLAMKYYLISQQHSDVSNIRAFRILSLWLENRTCQGLDKLMQECLEKIPSYKFVPILPQLAPHLTNNTNDDFGNNIMKIIERCAKDHPHHTLPIILALVNSNKDGAYSKSNAKTESNEARVSGAQILLSKLKQNAPELNDIIAEMELAAEALIQLAYASYDTCQKLKHKNSYGIPANLKVHKIKNFTHMLLPTQSLAVRKNCNYHDVIGIHSYNKEFDKVGGINNPKRLFCRGTDGVTRNQLLKGKDDLRQDAVMEQVFDNINKLLHAEKQTRHLLIRTYKVVPLSRRSGILEWVESVPIGEYLIGAHREYNPSDWTAEMCRAALTEVSKKSSGMKLKKFKEVCTHFKPIFHKFFETNYLEPLVWYERRKAYMHSVATTSMCGYILGLGDRHLQNILLDKFSAEVIHIDFGIAFEQGMVLPTPETVPFRLTRDIEDAMGVTGIEGVFRGSCERTMEVMRKNAETIVTILEVLLYDPLYEWTISPSEAYSMQFHRETDNETNAGPVGSEEESVPVNVSAERALLRLKQKLHGSEEGGASSVEGQVQKLIQQARDPSNLCRLYPGWQPFL